MRDYRDKYYFCLSCSDEPHRKILFTANSSVNPQQIDDLGCEDRLPFYVEEAMRMMGWTFQPNPGVTNVIEVPDVLERSKTRSHLSHRHWFQPDLKPE